MLPYCMNGCMLHQNIKEYLKPWATSPVCHECISLKVLVKKFDHAHFDLLARVLARSMTFGPFQPTSLCDNMNIFMKCQIVPSCTESVATLRFKPRTEDIESLLRQNGYVFTNLADFEEKATITCQVRTEATDAGAFKVVGSTETFDTLDLVTFRPGPLCPKYALLVLEKVFERLWTQLYPNNPGMVVERVGLPSKDDIIYVFMPDWAK